MSAARDRQRRRRLDQRAVEARGNDEHAALERTSALPRAGAQQAAAGPAGALEALAHRRHVLEQPRHLVEHDERGCARERIADVRVRVDVRLAELPERLEARRARRAPPRAAARRRAPCRCRGCRRRRRRATARRRARGRRRSRRRRAARRPRRSARATSRGTRRRHARARASLHRLDDHARRVGGQRARILAVRAAVHRAREARLPRLAELLEARRREREQAGAVVRAVEGDDAGPAGGEQRGAQRDLDRVLARDAELRGPRQRVRGSGRVTSASARSPSACTTLLRAPASRMRGLRWPSAATPKPPDRSSSSRPSVSVTRQPSALRPDHAAAEQREPSVVLRDRSRRSPGSPAAGAASTRTSASPNGT